MESVPEPRSLEHRRPALLLILFLRRCFLIGSACLSGHAADISKSLFMIQMRRELSVVLHSSDSKIVLSL